MDSPAIPVLLIAGGPGHQASRSAPRSRRYAKSADHVASADKIGFRHLWGQAKREEREALLESLDAGALFDSQLAPPVLRLGLPFVPMAVSPAWFDWPALPDLFPVSFPGVKTSRDSFSR